jgi:hypothetical protein
MINQSLWGAAASVFVAMHAIAGLYEARIPHSAEVVTASATVSVAPSKRHSGIAAATGSKLSHRDQRGRKCVTANVTLQSSDTRNGAVWKAVFKNSCDAVVRLIFSWQGQDQPGTQRFAMVLPRGESGPHTCRQRYGCTGQPSFSAEIIG